MTIDELIKRLIELKQQAEDYTNKIDIYFCLNGEPFDIEIENILLDEKCDITVYLNKI